METHNAEILLKNEEIEAKNAPIEQLQRQRDEYIAG